VSVINTLLSNLS